MTSSTPSNGRDSCSQQTVKQGRQHWTQTRMKEAPTLQQTPEPRPLAVAVETGSHEQVAPAQPTTAPPPTATTAAPPTVNAPPPAILFSPADIEALEFAGILPRGVPAPALHMFWRTCQEARINPFRRQVYLRERNHPQGGSEPYYTVEIGIDGLRAIAESTGAYAGSDDALFEYDSIGNPMKATVTVWKFVQGVRCPFTASARWKEFLPEQDNRMWSKMPHSQLEKCAEARALRKACPNLASLYIPEEMDQSSGGSRIQHTAVSAEIPSTSTTLRAATTPEADKTGPETSASEPCARPDLLPAQRAALEKLFSLCKIEDRNAWLEENGYSVTDAAISQGEFKTLLPKLNMLYATRSKQKPKEEGKL